MKLIEKMSKAKMDIKNLKLKKQGHNKFSNYEYFTPEQIEFLVSNVCFKNRMETKFDLKRNELGETGYLTVFDLDSDETLVYEMASAIPEIKATNIAQQLGGAMTYTERYLKTSAFGITDNNIDFDCDKPQTPKEAIKEALTPIATPTPSTTKPDIKEAVKAIGLTTTKESLTKIWTNNVKLFTGSELEEFTKAKDKQKIILKIK